MKSFISSVVMAALCLGSFVFTSCDPDDNKTPDSLTFSVAKAEVEVGKTVEVKAAATTVTVTDKDGKTGEISVKVE